MTKEELEKHEELHRRFKIEKNKSSEYYYIKLKEEHERIQKMLKMKKFTIEEIRKYLLSQDSKGDILYNLSEENIIKANQIEDDIDFDKWKECSINDHVMTIEEYNEDVREGLLTHYDGFYSFVKEINGIFYYRQDDFLTGRAIFPPDECTHVVWFNK